jgi:hypothetical protein
LRTTSSSGSGRSASNPLKGDELTFSVVRSPLVIVLLPLVVACGGAESPPAAGPGPAAGPHLPAPLDAAVSRVRALIDLPDQRGIEEAFSSAFLAHIPVDRLQGVFLEAHTVGPCNLQRVLSTESETSGKVHLACTTGGEDVTLAVESAPPYKITLLIIKPSP